MVAAVGIPVFPQQNLHRLAAPRPVEFAQPPGLSTAPAGAAAAGPTPSGPLVAGAAISQLLQIDSEWSGGASAFARARAAGAYGLASMAETAALAPLAPKLAYEEVSGLGYLPAEALHDPHARHAHLRDQIAAARDAARREQQMSAAAGHEVRLAYDPNAGEAVALHPGDAGYDDVYGARAAFEQMRWDLQKMGESPARYADLLRL